MNLCQISISVIFFTSQICRSPNVLRLVNFRHGVLSRVQRHAVRERVPGQGRVGPSTRRPRAASRRSSSVLRLGGDHRRPVHADRHVAHRRPGSRRQSADGAGQRLGRRDPRGVYRGE